MIGAKVTLKRRKLIKLQTKLSGPTNVKVGFPSGKASQDIVNRAIWNHYGTNGGGWGGPIPARPFLLNAIRKHRREYLQAMKTSASKLIRGETDLRTVMSKLGAKAQGDIQQEITELRDPPNSPVTIRLKGSDNPLIDSGEMRSKVTWKLDKWT